MYTVYILKSKARKWVYVGMTTDIEARLARHQKGGVTSTRPYIPIITFR